jgi:hypothetical protein
MTKWYIINMFPYSGNNGQKNRGGRRELMEVEQANYGLKKKSRFLGNTRTRGVAELC